MIEVAQCSDALGDALVLVGKTENGFLLMDRAVVLLEGVKARRGKVLVSASGLCVLPPRYTNTACLI